VIDLREPTPKRWRHTLASPHVPPWLRNINRILDRILRLGVSLGPANCQLTNIAGKPLDVRRLGFSPNDRCYYHQDFRCYVVHWSLRPNFYPRSTPPYLSLSADQGIGSWFSPFHFQSPDPRRVSCYTLLS